MQVRWQIDRSKLASIIAETLHFLKMLFTKKAY